jgi:hypothetical protein
MPSTSKEAVDKKCNLIKEAGHPPFESTHTKLIKNAGDPHSASTCIKKALTTNTKAAIKKGRKKTIKKKAADKLKRTSYCCNMDVNGGGHLRKVDGDQRKRKGYPGLLA